MLTPFKKMKFLHIVVVLLSTMTVLLMSTPELVASPLPRLRISAGNPIGTLNPSEAQDFVTIRYLLNLGMGLTRFDTHLSVINGLAKGWTISKSGRTYRFTLGRHFWSDGTPVKAQDFVTGLKHSLSPEVTCRLCEPILDLVEGAKSFKHGTLKDFDKVGIKASGGEIIEIHLTRSSPFFLSLLSLPFAFPQRQGFFSITKGTPTCGFYQIAELKTQSLLLLKPQPHSTEKVDNEVEFRVVSEGTTAVSLFEHSELDVVEKVPSQLFQKYSNDTQLIKSPFLATYYLGFNISKQPFATRDLRLAIALAIDRSEIDKVLKDPQRLARSFVPFPLEGSRDEISPGFDPQRAKEIWTKISDKPNHLDLVSDLQEKNKTILELIQAQLRKNLGVEVGIKSYDWKSYLKLLSQEKPGFFRFAWLVPYPDSIAALEIFTSGNSNNFTSMANQNYDSLIRKISVSGSQGGTLIRQAQEILLKDEIAVIPLYHYNQYFLIKKAWEGLEVTPMGLIDLHRAHRGPSL